MDTAQAIPSPARRPAGTAALGLLPLGLLRR